MTHTVPGRGRKSIPQVVVVLVMLLASVAVAGAHPTVSGGLTPIGMLTYIWGTTDDMVGLRDGLQERGYQQDEQVALGVRFAEADDTLLASMVEQVLRDGAKIIYVNGWKVLRAVQQATSETPIVFTDWYDPVRTGAIDKLATNVTGVTHAFPEVNPRSLDMFHALLPNLQRVLLPYDAADPHVADQLQALRDAAGRLKIDLLERPLRSQEGAKRVIMTLRQGEVDGILPVGGRFNIAGYALQASQQHHIPALFPRAWMAEYGGLASYGPSWYGLGREAATLVDRLLRGAKPTELPVQVTQQAELVINLRAAAALGITISPPLLAQADKVIR
jgi:putative ABC transport system substrate-binding protein